VRATQRRAEARARVDYARTVVDASRRHIRRAQALVDESNRWLSRSRPPKPSHATPSGDT
jgi:hypothetical protein